MDASKYPNFLARTEEEEREEIFALLQPNIDNNTPKLIPQKRSYSLSSQVFFISGSSHKIINRSSYCGPMDNYILFNFLNLFLKLPDRHVLGGDVLKQVVDDADKAMETALKEDPVGITLTFDEWTNIKNEQLLGTVLLSSEGKPYITIYAIVIDSAPVYATARRQIRISKRSITFLPCFAHQINLCVGEIFKESIEFKTAINYAIRLAAFFKNSNHRFFIVRLKEQQYETYKKYIAISVPGETHWNSLYYMCTSLLKTQQVLQSSKALQISKLRVDIIYNHRLHNSPIFVDDTNEINKNTGNLNGPENTKDDDSDVNLEAGLKQIEESLDDKDNESQLGNGFSEYLHGWAEMLEEEKNAKILDEEENVESVEKSNTPLDNITHPANDDNVKWNLLTLFNYNMNVDLLF
ncbi:hypothetical protein RclHR1_08550006 [Rhizophagus clarus]|uniref:DUF659 domain-containing protein n=1 Tax=Rhizophagus clarus TaxID=94130 RepID=A0A2Z6SFH6_9GLOM|nr:hypothetical protein RclHR1_08550006 [Rhizophagus clarus]